MLPSEMRVDLLRLLESVGGDVERAEASRDQLQALLTERHAKDEHMTDAQLTLMELLLRVGGREEGQGINDERTGGSHSLVVVVQMYTLEVARSGQSGVGMEVVAEALEVSNNHSLTLCCPHLPPPHLTLFLLWYLADGGRQSPTSCCCCCSVPRGV